MAFRKTAELSPESQARARARRQADPLAPQGATASARERPLGVRSEDSQSSTIVARARARLEARVLLSSRPLIFLPVRATVQAPVRGDETTPVATADDPTARAFARGSVLPRQRQDFQQNR